MADSPTHKLLSVLPLDLGNSALLASFTEYIGACAAVCLNRAEHQTGVRMVVEGDRSEAFFLSWESLTVQHHRTCADLQESTEYGAYAIAFLIIREITGKTVLERSAKGPGFDFWIGDEEPVDLPFQGLTRLEVSGILSGSDADVQARARVKRRQVAPSDAWGPALIAIIEFGRPVIRLEGK